MIDNHNQWWNRCCERAERTTAKQIGLPHEIYRERTPIAVVRAAVAKLMASKAANSDPPHRSASLRCALLLAATNKRRAELGQPLAPLD